MRFNQGGLKNFNKVIEMFDDLHLLMDGLEYLQARKRSWTYRSITIRLAGNNVVAFDEGGGRISDYQCFYLDDFIAELEDRIK